jgi:hypothetical protein
VMSAEEASSSAVVPTIKFRVRQCPTPLSGNAICPPPGYVELRIDPRVVGAKWVQNPGFRA